MEEKSTDKTKEGGRSKKKKKGLVVTSSKAVVVVGKPKEIRDVRVDFRKIPRKGGKEWELVSCGSEGT